MGKLKATDNPNLLRTSIILSNESLAPNPVDLKGLRICSLLLKPLEEGEKKV